MNETNKITIGKLLRADNSGFIAGCRVSELDAPMLGALTKVPMEDGSEIFGLISNISISDDGLVRQLVSRVAIPPEYTADNRYNRNLPVEINVLAVGHRTNKEIYHLLPPRPPLSLDTIYLCTTEELRQFTSVGHFGYFRHIMRAIDLPISEILAAHLKAAKAAHEESGNVIWFSQAAQELITLLRDDHTTLTNVLGALANIDPSWN